MSIFSKRLKAARAEAGISQERLGIEAGIDPGSASARMNQYEKDKHAPNATTVVQIAAVLNLPTSYFYSDDDGEAEILKKFHRMTPENRQVLLEIAEGLAEKAKQKRTPSL